jgi:lysyl-tRNA synthetase, class I
MPQKKSDNRESLFWADQIADEIATRKSFHYIAKKVPVQKKHVVKTSASISGVLHIGRLSDTIRVDTVVRALLDRGAKAEMIWVAEDMDPLRKVPKGVPKSFSRFIGMPVTDIPDPDGCHKTYAEHHTDKYFEVLEDFTSVPMKRHSTRLEYQKGSFRPYIREILRKVDLMREIQNRYRSDPLLSSWSPWKPVCDNCGKIITTKVTGFSDGKALYRCEDYRFENTLATGCGHSGENDPMKGNGKLVWKGEWAAEWAMWKVSSEGAGKEYQVPNSAWWVNGEIVERVLGYPMPVPIFYEHLMIDNEKMSASKGNVVYPADWLNVATPELLRFFYSKKIMKTRSFSWADLPKIYDDYDAHAAVYHGEAKIGNEREKEHMTRLHEISLKGKPGRFQPQVPFDFAVTIAQIVPEKELLAKGIDILLGTGHLKEKPTGPGKKAILERLRLAKAWADRYAPDRYRFELQEKASFKPGKGATKVIRALAKRLREKEWKADELLNLFYDLAKENGVDTREFFRAMYRILIDKEYGPRLAPFILSIGRKKVAKMLDSV